MLISDIIKATFDIKSDLLGWLSYKARRTKFEKKRVIDITFNLNAKNSAEWINHSKK